MPELILPDGRVQLSFLTAMKEFQAEGRGGPSDNNSMLGREIRRWGDGWEDPAVVRGVRRLAAADAREGSSRPPGYVPRPRCGGRRPMSIWGG